MLKSEGISYISRFFEISIFEVIREKLNVRISLRSKSSPTLTKNTVKKAAKKKVAKKAATGKAKKK